MSQIAALTTRGNDIGVKAPVHVALLPFEAVLEETQ